MKRLALKGTWTVIAVGFLLGEPAAPSLAQRLVSVRTRETKLGAEVLMAEEVWLRLRGPGRLSEASRVVQNLTEVLLAGLRPEDVQVKAAAPGVHELRGKGTTLVTATRQEAAAQKSTPAGLAQGWAKRLRELVSSPYVAYATAAVLQVPVGETRAVRIGGTAASAPQVAVEPADLATAELRGGSIVVRALRAGNGELRLSTATATAVVPLRARHWAAIVPSMVSVPLTAPLKPNEWPEAAKAALACAVRAQPSADVRVAFTSLSPADTAARLVATAPDCLPVSTIVRLEGVASERRLPLPRRVWVSNYPERVREPAALLRDRLAAGDAVRVLWHHVNNSSGALWFSVRLWNLGEAAVTFAWSGAVSGPGRDEVYAGHVAARNYLDLLNRGAALVTSLPGRSWVELASVRTRPGEIVSGVGSLALLAGEALIVEVVAHAAPPLPACRSITTIPDHLSRLSRFDFAGVVETQASFAAGDPWRFIRVGHIPTANDEGKLLHGNYGVLYWIDLQISNPTTERTEVELAAHAPGGAARMVLLLDGQLLDTPLLNPTAYYLIHRWVLKAGESRRVVVGTMPQAGSNYPVALILRTPPR